MRIFVASDIHGRTGMLEKAAQSIHNDFDAVLFLGDLTNLGDSTVAEKVAVAGGKKCFAIPGNFDSPETLDEMESLEISLHGKKVKMGKYTLAGFGGGIHGSAGKVLYSELEVSKKLEKLLKGEENVVLATHMPPKETSIDLASNGFHGGSAAVRQAIEKHQPLLHLCGHIHEAIGEEMLGKTRSMNVGAIKEGHALLLELGKGLLTKRIKVK